MSLPGWDCRSRRTEIDLGRSADADIRVVDSRNCSEICEDYQQDTCVSIENSSWSSEYPELEREIWCEVCLGALSVLGLE